MLGDDLLVAPVLQPGVENWTVYLPGKDTIHYYNFAYGESMGH